MNFTDHVRACKSALTKKLTGKSGTSAPMAKLAFWEGFDKEAGAAAELAGLGTLALPSAAHLAGHDMSERHKSMLELGGLGILAAPYAKDVAKKGATTALKLFRRGT